MKQVFKGLFFSFLYIIGLNAIIAQPSKYYGTSGAVESSSVGIQVGSGVILGDVTYSPLVQGGIYYQRHLKKWLAGRIGLSYGLYRGADTDRTGAIEPNNALNGGIDPSVNYLNVGFVYQNYQTNIIHLDVGLKLNLIQMLSPKYDRPFSVYITGNTGFLKYATKTDALDASGNIYPYQTIMSNNPSEIKKALSEMRDKKYESFAEFDKTNHILLNGGVGLRYKIGEKTAAGIESQLIYLQDDLLDGQRWKSNTELSLNPDIILNTGLFFEYLF